MKRQTKLKCSEIRVRLSVRKRKCTPQSRHDCNESTTSTRDEPQLTPCSDHRNRTTIRRPPKTCEDISDEDKTWMLLLHFEVTSMSLVATRIRWGVPLMPTTLVPRFCPVRLWLMRRPTRPDSAVASTLWGNTIVVIFKKKHEGVVKSKRFRRTNSRCCWTWSSTCSSRC